MATSPAPTLADEVLRTLAERGFVKTYPRHTILISEGDRSDALFIILDGKVKVFVGDAQGREVVLGVQGPGEYFGEMTLDAGPRSASVMTLEKCRLVIVPGDTLGRFVAEHPDFALHLIRTLIHRVRTLTDNVRSLALLDVYGRVARLLLELACERDGELVVAQRLTQLDIANRVGASREMVSRILKELVAGGYIRIERRVITINRRLPARR